MLAVNQYLCTSAEIKQRYNRYKLEYRLSRSVYMASWYMQAFAKPRISTFSQRMYTNTGSLLIPYLCAAPCSVFRANPQPERESDIGAPVDQLPVPIQFSGIYPMSTLTLLTCHDLPGFLPQNFALSKYERKAWGRG